MSQTNGVIETEENVIVSTAEKLEQVANNVVEIELIYRDKEENITVLKRGSGFFVGTAESAPQHILTSYRLVNMEPEEKELLQQSQEGDGELSIRIVVKKDVTINASVVSDSESMGFALLNLEQPMYDRSFMVINDSFVLQETEPEVYSIGILLDDAGENMVQVSRGKLYEVQESEGVGIWHHDSYRNAGYIGSPLVDEDGTVIGINQGLDKGEFQTATQITEVLPVLDALGIGYWTTTKEEVYQSTMAVSGNVPTGVETPKEINWGPILLIIGAVIFVVGIITTIVLIKTKESRAEKKRRKKEELTVMHAAPVFERNLKSQNEVVLIRVKTGQREVVSGEKFFIGKERGKTDFYIGDNSAVSRMHACIIKKESNYYLTECQAINGTFVNGERVYPGTEKLLCSGDKVRLADEEFEFLIL